ncbi:hypothetical protein WJX72_002768 [[Myrmecia] bisecta]|uniref:Uncharacterized protein n=1 Tax=[Myrmecia] bisecta TaxID=41462 RepID=A0AAW1R5A3_9CHLO
MCRPGQTKPKRWWLLVRRLRRYCWRSQETIAVYGTLLVAVVWTMKGPVSVGAEMVTLKAGAATMAMLT